MPQYGETTFDENGQEWFVWDFKAKFKVPWDPDNPVIVLCAPPGGVGHANFPAMVKGDPGMHALIQSAIDFVALEHNDATPDSAEFEIVQPATATLPQISKLKLRVHKGTPGTDGSSVLNPDSFGTPVFKRILQVNAAATGFEFTVQKVGGMHWAPAITEAPAGTTAGFTVASISIAANTYPFAWRPAPSGVSIVSGSTSDMQVDLVARLTDSGGAVLGRCPGLVGAVDRLILPFGPDDGAGDTVNKIAANAAATIILRTEKQAGTGTYATGIIAPSRFGFLAVPVP